MLLLPGCGNKTEPPPVVSVKGKIVCQGKPVPGVLIRFWPRQAEPATRPVETVYQFEPAGAGTKLTISMELAGGYPAAAEGMVKQQMQKSLDEQCHRIKQMVEK